MSDETEWRDRAGCTQWPTRVWFTHPSGVSAADRRRMAHMCWECPVQAPCLIDAVARGADGTTRAGHWFRSDTGHAGRPRPRGWFWAEPEWRVLRQREGHA